MTLPTKIKTALQQGNTLWAEAITPRIGWQAWVQINPSLRGDRTYSQALDEWTSTRQADEPYDDTILSYKVVYEQFLIGQSDEATQELRHSIMSCSLSLYQCLESNYHSFVTRHNINKAENSRSCRIDLQEWYSQDRAANGIINVRINVENTGEVKIRQHLFINEREEVTVEDDAALLTILSKWVADLSHLQIGIADRDDQRYQYSDSY